MKYILETQNLSKKYGKQYAASHVNMHLEKGQIYGLIGRNGAGKTTILRILSGLALPTEGDFKVFEQNGIGNPLIKSRIGCLIENPGIYPNMTASQNLRLKCIALGITGDKAVDELLNIVDLADTGKKKAGKFSLGMKQRLGIAMALVGNPDIVILDEPINGLDPQGIVEVRETIERLNTERGITFIISSHLLDELSKIANKYGIIHGGNLIEEFTKEELDDKCSKRIELRVDNVKNASSVLEGMGISEYKVMDNNNIHISEYLDKTGEITMALSKAGVMTIEITIKNETLEDFYLHITEGGKNV